MNRDTAFMLRCVELARKGAGHVAPNPMVGAVLVHGQRIIGEGWHQQYGEAHAEVNCIKTVAPQDQALIPEATMYVSLEPCAHFGKTPPCADLIIAHQIPRVVIGSQDPFPDVNGKGIAKLRAAGVDVVTGIASEACEELNHRFFTFHRHHRPYVILKWAMSANGKMAANGDERLLISNDLSNRLVHQWRSEEAAILVGSRTALLDNPSLTNRLWTGRHPIRLVVDIDLSLPAHLHVFDGQTPTIVFNTLKHDMNDALKFYQVTGDVDLVNQILHALYVLKIQSVLVEGGAKTLQAFLGQNCWDEIRVITNTTLHVDQGLQAPAVPASGKKETLTLLNDLVTIYYPS
ncbi:MAG: bifunctional diaminohydroxyphosphoribosylaminopyrimidine deaminase/5-amino-6-(5-phosphoribosylamino)uracil reductase RibD [Sphingobacteriales bacterium]|nr:MAG: bifunctional diaminohydroxyphosphoribosylaminopyrimidine deaminase/5-amino-6-(5-phosphoribosylamino)uracil reductase RibD [Sphingobacteriales bacterium]